MKQFAECFQEDLALFKFANSNALLSNSSDRITSTDDTERFRSWKRIAARDGAMNIFHFYSAIDACLNPKLWKRVPTIQKYLDLAKGAEAKATFMKAFPDYKGIRDSVGHAAENVSTPERNSVFSAKSETGFIDLGGVPFIGAQSVRNLVIGSGFIGNRFHISFKGAVLSYEVSDATLDRLVEVAQILFSAVADFNVPYGPTANSRQV